MHPSVRKSYYINVHGFPCATMMRTIFSDNLLTTQTGRCPAEPQTSANSQRGGFVPLDATIRACLHLNS